MIDDKQRIMELLNKSKKVMFYEQIAMRLKIPIKDVARLCSELYKEGKINVYFRSVWLFPGERRDA